MNNYKVLQLVCFCYFLIHFPFKSNGQMSITLRGACNFNNYTIGDDRYEYTATKGFELSAGLKIPIIKKIGVFFQPELKYSQRGIQHKYVSRYANVYPNNIFYNLPNRISNPQEIISLNYIEIPLFLRKEFSFDKLGIYLMAGVSPFHFLRSVNVRQKVDEMMVDNIDSNPQWDGTREKTESLYKNTLAFRGTTIRPEIGVGFSYKLSVQSTIGVEYRYYSISPANPDYETGTLNMHSMGLYYSISFKK